MARDWQAFRHDLRYLRGGADWTMMPNSLDEPHIPPRVGIFEDGRETLDMLRGCSQTVHVVLVALTDGVELEIWADGALRRRSRFLRDGEARKHAGRLAGRLERRGYRRGPETP